MRRCALTLAATAALTVSVDAQSVAPASSPTYTFLLLPDTRSLKAGLDVVAKDFAVAFLSDRGLLLARMPGGGAEEYWPIRVDDSESLEKELNAAGQRGFQAIPQTLTASDDDIVAIMGRRSVPPTERRYRVVAANDAFQRTTSDLLRKGFVPIGGFSRRSSLAARLGRSGQLHVILEATAVTETPRAAAADDRLRVISATRTSTLEKDINAAVAEGYRVAAGSLMNVLLERGDDRTLRFTYRLMAATRVTTLLTEIQQAGQEGYRIVPSMITPNPGQRETLVLAERPVTGARRYAYDFIIPPLSGRQPSITFEPQNGFVPIGVFVDAFESYVIVLERPLEQAP